MMSSSAWVRSWQTSMARWKVTGRPSAASTKQTKEGLVYSSVSCETADDDAVSTQLASHADVGKHGLYLNRSIEEVPAAWADDDVELDIDSSACGEDSP